jgi:ATP-binding cassette subfamily C protein
MIRQGISVQLEELAFKNESDDEYLWQPFSLEIKPNQSVAITGPSGSGKTTLINLIMGYLEPSLGSVRLDGETPRNWIRMNPGTVSFVPQFPKVLFGSILENIALGHGDTEDDVSRVEQLMFDVGLGDLLRRTGRWKEDILDSNSLSGGQIQRLGLVRALFTNPRLLILDEPTSAVDSDQEISILEVISTYNETTKVLITHREVTASRMNKIIQLSNVKENK